MENHEGGRGVIEKVENILQLRSNKVNLDPQSLSDDVVHHCFDRFSCKQNIDLWTTTINIELHLKDEYFYDLGGKCNTHKMSYPTFNISNLRFT